MSKDNQEQPTQAPTSTPDHSSVDLELEHLAKQAEGEDFQPPWEEVNETEQAEAAPEISTGELLTTLLSVGFSLVASRKGSHWALTEGEAAETGNALGAVADKYFPDLAGGGVELVACLTVVMVLTPRIMQDKAIAAEAEQARALAEQGSTDEAA